MVSEGANPPEVQAFRLAQCLQIRPSMNTSTSSRLAPVGAVREPAAGDVRATPSLPERHLLAQLRAGDESAFSEIVHRYHSTLMRLATAFHPNRAFAEEVVQDTWMAVVDGLASFRGQSSLKTWICRILSNRAKTRLVREGRMIPLSALQSSEADEPAVDEMRFLSNGSWAQAPQGFGDQSPESRLMRKEAIGCLLRALGGLTVNQRTVVTLRDVEGLEAEEVCNILGIGETNQRVLLHRARSKLRQALEGHLIGA